MKKLFKQEFVSTKDNNELREEIEKVISDNLDLKEMSKTKRFFFNKWFFRASLLLILPLIFAMILSIEFDIMLLLGFSVFALVMDFFSIWVCSSLKSGYKINIQRKASENHLKIFKMWFSKNYVDASIDEQVDLEKMVERASLYPGANVSTDSSIWKVIPGYSLKSDNGITIQSIIVDWGSVKSVVKARTDFEVKKVYFAISGAKDVFKDFNFSMNQNKVSAKKRTELENMNFSASWSYKTNDEVKARMILTPSVQEDVLKMVNELDFQIEKVDDVFWVSFDIERFDNTFSINLPVTASNLSNKDEIINNLTNNTFQDIDNFQKWIKNIVVFRTLFKTI